MCTASPLGGASVGLSVRSLASGQIVACANEQMLLRPASIQKLFATALALDSLGVEYRYETAVLYSGIISGGVLRGDLFVVGSGDPSLGSRFLDSTRPEALFAHIHRALSSAGIRSISGRIVAVSHRAAQHPVPDTWLWQDIGNYYGAGPDGFCFMDNTYQLHVQTSAAGKPVLIKGTVPPMPELIFSSYATSQAIFSDESYIFGAPFSAERQLHGQLPANRAMQIKGSMPQPGLVFARELARYLSANGVAVSGIPMLADTIDVPVYRIAGIKSPTLSRIVAATNKNSLNLFAEQLMLSVTAEGLYAQHTEELQQSIQNALPNDAVCRFYDASGLSPFNLASADVFARFLYSVSSAQYFLDFEQSLPVAAIDGTLKSWCRTNGLAGKVVAKTGSMTSTRSLAGYIVGRDGARYSFCIIVNNYSASNADVKAFIEKLLVMIYNN